MEKIALLGLYNNGNENNNKRRGTNLYPLPYAKQRMGNIHANKGTAFALNDLIIIVNNPAKLNSLKAENYNPM